MASGAAAPGGGMQAVITGVGVTSVFGRGTGALAEGVFAGVPGFGQVSRFHPGRCRTRVAATVPGAPALAAELAAVIGDACAAAALGPDLAAHCPLLVALHSDPVVARSGGRRQVAGDAAALAAARCGMPSPRRLYATACVAATSAIADAAAMIAAGRAERVMVAAGYLVDADSFALFDAGRALASDGQVRPFSAGRTGMLLGDAVAAVVLESAGAARGRGVTALAALTGWGRAGDGYHVCDPRPDGAGLARAISAALERAGAAVSDIGYVNANGTGTILSDPAEAAALRRAFGDQAGQVPVSSTKALHGHALEASGLLELIVTIVALRAGRLPVNAGFLARDSECELDLVLEAPRDASPRYALSLNAAFGGANTALLLEAA